MYFSGIAKYQGMPTPVRILIAILIVFYFKTPSFSQATADCNGDFYMVTLPSLNGNSSFFKYNVDTATSQTNIQMIKNDLGRQVAVLGYRTDDKLFYGVDKNTKEILRIDVNGNVTNLGHPNFFDTTLVYEAGDVSPNGKDLFLIGRDPKTGLDSEIYSVGIGGSVLNSGSVSVQSNNSQVGDVAYDPFSGILYGFDNNNKILTTISEFSGTISSLNFNSVGVNQMGALFFDKKGNLYGYGTATGSEEKTLFAINKINGSIMSLKNDVLSRLSDGCSCPYTFDLLKSTSSRQVFPCSEFTMTYTIINRLGKIPVVHIRDSFPPDFIIKNVALNTVPGSTINGVGTNILDAINLPLSMGQNQITITLQVGATATGTYRTRAKLFPLPNALGGQVLSDDPLTAHFGDATQMEVTTIGKLLDKNPTVLCEGGEIKLSAKVNGVNYLWSTGETTKEIKVNTPGWYSLSITTDCGTTTDSVYVQQLENTMAVDLGDDIVIELGETAILSSSLLGAFGAIEYQWHTNTATDIPCVSCPDIAVRPISDATFGLTIANQYGCLATDSIHIKVDTDNREVFIPNAFTPDFDGYNDIFYVQGQWEAALGEMKIFDRWGNLIFFKKGGQINDSQNGWDGRYKGEQAIPGVYIYVIEIVFIDGVKKQFTGDITLIH